MRNREHDFSPQDLTSLLARSRLERGDESMRIDIGGVENSGPATNGPRIVLNNIPRAGQPQNRPLIDIRSGQNKAFQFAHETDDARLPEARPDVGDFSKFEEKYNVLRQRLEEENVSPDAATNFLVQRFMTFSELERDFVEKAGNLAQRKEVIAKAHAIRDEMHSELNKYTRQLPFEERNFDLPAGFVAVPDSVMLQLVATNNHEASKGYMTLPNDKDEELFYIQFMAKAEKKPFKEWTADELLGMYKKAKAIEKNNRMYQGTFAPQEYPLLTVLDREISRKLTSKELDPAAADEYSLINEGKFEDPFSLKPNRNIAEGPGAATAGVTRINPAPFAGQPELIPLVNEFNNLMATDAFNGQLITDLMRQAARQGSPEAEQLVSELQARLAIQNPAENTEREAREPKASRDLKKQFEDIRSQMARMSYGDLRTRLVHETEGEYGEYAQIFRDAMERLDFDPELIEFRLRTLIGSATTVDELKVNVNSLMGDLARKDKQNREGMYGKVPNDIQELCSEIMDKSAPEWGINGEFALLNKETNTLNKDNFLRWLRTQAMYWDGFSPDDKMSFFSEIKTPTTPRQHSFQDMVSVDSFFIDRDSGKLLGDFRDQCLHEIWLLQDARNWDVEYRRAMGEEDKTAQVIQSLFFTNTFTKLSSGVTTLERILKMSKNQDFNGADKGDQLIGKGLRRALVAYNYLGDLQMLRDILGDDAPLFQKKYWIQDTTKEEKLPGTNKIVKLYAEQEKLEGDGKNWNKDWFGEDGKLKFGDKDVRDAFSKYIDLFSSAKPDPRVVKEVRGRIADSIRYIVNRDDVVAKNDPRLKKIDLHDAEYAENWAFKMARWTGIAAKGSYDAWSKFQDTEDYRVGQMRSKRKGFYGNPYNIESFKGLSANFLTGTTTIDGKTILELIQGGQGSNIDGLKEDLGSFFFANNAMQKFADDHLVRSQKIFDFIINNNEFDFQKFVTHDPIRGTIFDHAKAKDVIDGIAKHIRYAYETWDLMDLGKVVRTKVTVNDKGEIVQMGSPHSHVVTKDISMAEKMFGGAILDEYKIDKNDPDAVEKSFDKYIDTLLDKRNKAHSDEEKHAIDTAINDVRAMIPQEKEYHEKFKDVGINVSLLRKVHKDGDFWHQGVLRELIAREIQSHTEQDSPYTPYTFAERETYFDFLSHHYLGAEETKKVRKIANAPFWKLFLQTLGIELGLGFVVEAAKASKDVAKSAVATG